MLSQSVCHYLSNKNSILLLVGQDIFVGDMVNGEDTDTSSNKKSFAEQARVCGRDG